MYVGQGRGKGFLREGIGFGVVKVLEFELGKEVKDVRFEGVEDLDKMGGETVLGNGWGL